MSSKFEKVKSYYERGLWDIFRVLHHCRRRIRRKNCVGEDNEE